ncbi:MAG TPA: GNAT family N-acetyltransferase [Jatrophihabitantaceae bacterium]|nr:GNAT family N-acetyltransferase [Jatrophihabitantaceae bacterium]
MSVRAASELAGHATLRACWTAIAGFSPGARVLDTSGAVAALFPPRPYLNNAIATDLSDVAGVVSELRALYDAASIPSWALWIPSSATGFDRSADRLRAVDGLRRDITTLVMHAEFIEDLPVDDRVRRVSFAAVERLALGDTPLPTIELGAPEDVPGLFAWALVIDGIAVAYAYTYLQDEDCGVYTVGTMLDHRRRGYARALVAHALADARERGARTASLQSTPMGERLYATLGFRSAGRYEEWTLDE